MSGFVIQGPKSNDHDSSGWKIDFFSFQKEVLNRQQPLKNEKKNLATGGQVLRKSRAASLHDPSDPPLCTPVAVAHSYARPRY